MASHTLPLLVIFLQVPLVLSSGTVQFWFRSWSNPDHSELAGGCCDLFCGSCDNRFTVCLDEDVPGSDDFNDCGLATIATKTVYDNDDAFDFPSDIPSGIPNPTPISFLTWQGHMRVKLQVWDEDSSSGDDLVEEDFTNINQDSAPTQSSAKWIEHTMGTHTVFTFRLQVYCNPDFYRADCSVFCEATDDHNGHFTCDPTTGDKICLTGWHGVDCDQDECASAPCLNGGTCRIVTSVFSCLCTEAFTGDTCDVDVDECQAYPCLNNGTCHNLPGSFNCTCEPDFVYADALCERDDCAPDPCSNGSTCLDLPGGNFSCLCPPGLVGDRCEEDVNECASLPCQNGANCTQGLDWFACECPPGFEGQRCQEEPDECLSAPCSGGATCEDLVAGFRCHCPPGFQGVSCGQETDECLSDPCRNNATCLDYVGFFECNCPYGFFGDFCEVDFDFCANQTCANNGTCVDRDDGFHCLCGTGYEGVTCDVETDECASEPCMNNATCYDLVAQFRCACPVGFEGEACETETDECLSSPCRNGSTCVDQRAGYQCLCAAGMEGPLCDTDTDECQSYPCHDNETCIDALNGYRCVDGLDMCKSSPCQNGATCVDADRGWDFSCTCPPGYEGALCQENTDECASSPCLQGATCQDLVQGFACHCPPGYEGALCQEDTDECASAPCHHGRCVDDVDGYQCVCTMECVNGHCVDGLCSCAEGFQGEDCTVVVDYCLSSPCHTGTCVPLFNGFRCECDPFHAGEHCESQVEDPCSVGPCLHGQCSPSDDANHGFACTCDTGFYGLSCDIDLKNYGCVILITGSLSDVTGFQMNMARLLDTLLTSSTREVRNGVIVDVLTTEDYIRSDNGEPLTRVTYVARSSSGYLANTEVERMVDEAPPHEVTDYLGQGIYKGMAERKPATGDHQSWVASNWYVLLGVGLAIVAMAAVIGAVIRSKRANRRNDWSEEPLEMEAASAVSYANMQEEGSGQDGGGHPASQLSNPVYSCSRRSSDNIYEGVENLAYVEPATCDSAENDC